MPDRHIKALAAAAALVVALGATCADAADIGYLAPPGIPAKEFPSPQRPVAQIVSPSRTGEEHRSIHARINRATGASSVGAATRDQLERGNQLLSRELRGS